MPTFSRIGTRTACIIFCCLLLVIGSGQSPLQRKDFTRELKQINVAVNQYHDRNQSYPIGGSQIDGGFRFPSWQVQLLPFVDQQALFDKIDRTSAWDSRANRPVFETEVRPYIGQFETTKKDANGLSVTHYSANSHVLTERGSTRIGGIPDGTSNTFFAGEIGSEFPAWGKPGNVRDLTAGLDGKQNHFGRSDGSGGWFLMFDGNVRSISAKVDPRILLAMATPAGGEDLVSLTRDAGKVAPKTMTPGAPGSSSPPTGTPQSAADPSDPDRFQQAYQTANGKLFRAVTPPTFRDQMLTAAWEKRPRTAIVPFADEPKLGFSREMTKIGEENEKAGQSPWTPPGSSSPATKAPGDKEPGEVGKGSAGKTATKKLVPGKKSDEKAIICMFTQHFLTNSTVTGFTLCRSSYSSSLADVLALQHCSVQIPQAPSEPWFPDQCVIKTRDGREPDFGFRGDLVVKTVLGQTALRQFLDELEDYCANGPADLHNVRFRIVSQEIVAANFRGKSPRPVVKFKNAEERERDTANCAPYCESVRKDRVRWTRKR